MMKKIVNKNYPNPILNSYSVGIAELDTTRQKPPMKDYVSKKGQVVELYDLGNGKKFVFQKIAVCTETASNTTSIKVKKEHLFNVGDTIYTTANAKIISIDTSNEDYDILHLDTSVNVTTGQYYFWRQSGDNVNDSRFGLIAESFILEDEVSELSLDIHYGTLDLYTYLGNIGSDSIFAPVNFSQSTLVFVPYYA